MLFQSAMDPRTAEVGLRVVKNAYTATLTITAGSMAVGSPAILETNTASLPSTTTDSSVVQNWARRPDTSTGVINNLLIGLVAKVPGTKAYLDREEVGLVQCYGVYPNAAVQILTTTQLVGKPMIP